MKQVISIILLLLIVSAIDVKKGEYEDLTKLNCPVEYNMEDNSKEAKKNFDNKFDIEEDICKKGKTDYGNTKLEEVLPKTFSDCYTTYVPKDLNDQKTEWWKLEFSCQVQVIKEGKAKELEYEVNEKKKVDTCVEDSKCNAGADKCVEDEKTYKQNKENYTQCKAAVTKYKDVQPTEEYPFYMAACEQSLMPLQASEFKPIWEQKQKCQKYTSDMSIEKYEKCKIPTCPAIANIPEYDSASYAQKKKFDEHAATAICKKGFDIYGKATTKDVPFPKSLKQCYDTFIVEEKDKKTYMSLFILDCEKNCRDSGKKKEITFETNTKKEYTTCLATKDCKQGDDQCTTARTKYTADKGTFEQCIKATEEFKSVLPDQDIPYSMHACERSLSPKEDNTFYPVWTNYFACQKYKSDITKQIYDDCSNLNCPKAENIQDWDTDSQFDRTAFQKYKNESETCQKGEATYKAADNLDPYPRKLNECYTSYQPTKGDTIWNKYIFQCQKKCFTDGKPTELTFETSIRSAYEKCRINAKDCSDQACKIDKEKYKDQRETTFDQCKKAITQFNTLPLTADYPYSMYACEISLKPQKETTFFPIWQEYMDCSQYSSPITKKIFDECSASYCPVNIEDWDKDSKDSVVEFKNYKDKTDMCIQGDKRYKDAQPTSPYPRKLTECIDQFSPKKADTYWKSFLLDCWKTCATPNKQLAIPFETNTKAVYESCRQEKDCVKDDKECNNDKDAYIKKKVDLAQCEKAVIDYGKVLADDDVIYSIYACENSIKPAPTSAFLHIWMHYQQCQKYTSTITIEKYNTCTKLACPTEIQEWDTQSKDALAEFTKYKEKDEKKMCKEGQKRFDDAQPSAPYPRKLTSCINEFTSTKLTSIWNQYHLTCMKTCLNFANPPDIQVEVNIKIKYDSCRAQHVCPQEKPDCDAGKKAYEKIKETFQQCKDAVIAYKNLEADADYPYYMQSCEASVQPETKSEFYPVYQKQVACMTYTSDISIQKYLDCKKPNCPLVANIPDWDKESKEEGEEFQKYLITKDKCIKGKITYEDAKAKPDSPYPRKLTECMNEYKVKIPKNTFMKTFILDCEKNCYEKAQPLDIKFETNTKKVNLECRQKQNCPKEDKDCLQDQEKYNENKKGFEQCKAANDQYDKKVLEDDVPYGIYACEKSLQPNAESKFLPVWKKYEECQQYSSNVTKKIYSDCTELACPIEKNIPDWDTESKALVDEFDAYIKKDEIKRCKEGEKRFKDAKPEEPFPRKYAECIDGYQPSKKDTYWQQYILGCQKNCYTNGKSPEISFEINAIKEYASCTKGKDCDVVDPDCTQAKGQYEKAKQENYQCIKAKTEYDKLKDTSDYPYYMHACERSAMPQKDSKYAPIWDYHFNKCTKYTSKISMKIYKDCKNPTCPSIDNIPDWDESSKKQAEDFKKFMTTDIDCIQGKKTYDDVKDDADPFSRKLTSCYNKFPIGADKTYMKQFIWDCEQSCINKGEQLQIVKETNSKKQTEDCRAKKDCATDDAPCIADKNKYIENKGKFQQCQLATVAYKDVKDNEDVIYPIYACENSLSPNPKSTFYPVWSNYNSCQIYSSEINIKKYSDCKDPTCPLLKNIQDWDKESKKLADKFKEYSEKDKFCIDGNKRYGGADPSEPYPRKLTECYNNFISTLSPDEQKTYASQFIFTCEKACYDKGTSLALPYEVNIKEVVQECRKNKECEKLDTRCKEQQETYEKNKKDFAQCKIATDQYAKIANEGDYPYSMHACENSCKPQDEDTKFKEIWQHYQSCQKYKSSITIEKQAECSSLNCPSFKDIQKWDTITDDLIQEYVQYQKDSVVCQEGMATYDKSKLDPKNNPYPRKLTECVNKFQSKKTPTDSYGSIILLPCEKQCVNTGFPPKLPNDMEPDIVSSVEKCQKAAKQCDPKAPDAQDCLDEKKIYDETIQKNVQCQKAVEQYKKIIKTDDEPYYIVSCDLSAQPIKTGAYYKIWEPLHQCHKFNGDGGKTVLQYNNCVKLNCPDDKYIPQWDTKSTKQKEEFSAYFTTGQVCKDGFEYYNKAKPEQPVPRKYKECMSKFPIKDENTFFIKFIHKCHIQCFNTGQAPPIGFDAHQIKEVENCQKDKKCKTTETQCLEEEKKYKENIVKYEQCVQAEDEKKKLNPDKLYPYSKYSCHKSLEPNPEDVKNGKDFHRVWVDLENCMKKPPNPNPKPKDGYILMFSLTILHILLVAIFI